jgi:predicted lipid-binding transport protein (Tim44 family)
MENGGIGDIIFFALLAGYVLWRLRAALGRKDDTIPPKSNSFTAAGKSTEKVVGFPGMERHEKPQPQKPTVAEPEIKDKTLAGTLEQIAQKDLSFTPGYFIEGANVAFEMVLEAFNEGDKDTLKRLLSKDIYEDFAESIDKREKQSKQQSTTLVAVSSTDITDVSFIKNVAEITITFVSEQISVTKDKNGKIVGGDPSHVDTITDEWVFQRNIASKNPNWTVIET